LTLSTTAAIGHFIDLIRFTTTAPGGGEVGMTLFGRGSSFTPVRKSASRVRLVLEALEDRLVPTAAATNTLTVAAGDTATLIADITAANASGTPTTINLTQSTYDFTSANNSTFGPNALPAVTGNITINGNGAVLMRDPSLGQNTPFRLFYVSGSEVAGATGGQLTGQAVGSLTLENVTLEDGLAQGGSSGTGGGGLGAGGAIFNQGNLTLNGVTVEQSAAQGGSSGSGTSSTGGTFGDATAPTTNFGIGGAGATTGNGGAGGFGAGGGVSSTGTVGAGGFGAGAGTTTTGGGGLGAGGAIFNIYGTTTVINSTLASNMAQGGSNGGSGYGGAVFNVDGTVNIISSTIADNAATAGGAVYNLSYGTPAASSGSTAQGAPSTVNVTDSILADSLASSDLTNDENSSTAGAAVVNYNASNIVMTTNTIDGATTNGTPLTSNPQLGLLYNNGGSTPTMALMAGSPASGAGAAASNVPTTDQRGVARGNVLDLGAYQGTPPETAMSTLSLTSSVNNTASSQSVTLTATVTSSDGTTVPAGTVQFVDTTTGTTLGSAAVSVVNGQAQASLTVTTLTPGSHTITAAYTSTNGLGGSSASTSAMSGSANQIWLNQVYEALLGRSIDPTGLAYWSNVLSGASRTQVAYLIEQTSAYRTVEIQNAFQKLLGRAADTNSLNYFLGLMSQGTTIQTVEAIIAGSAEFYQNSGGTNIGFLSALYQDFLNRPLDAAGMAVWGGALTSGQSTTQVAQGIIGTQEYANDLVEQDYLTYLQRPADPTSLNAFVSALSSGQTNNDMIVATLLGSGEYGTKFGTA
jgi:hypothetical protein